MCTQSQSEHLVSQFYWLFFLYFYGDVKIFFNLKVIRDKKVRSLGLCYIYASTRFVVLFFLVIYASLIIWYKFKENFYISTAIQEKQSVKLRTRVFWLWLCIICSYIAVEKIKNFFNFTLFKYTITSNISHWTTCVRQQTFVVQPKRSKFNASSWSALDGSSVPFKYEMSSQLWFSQMSKVTLCIFMQLRT